MGLYYLDTSGLLPYYHEEASSTQVQQFLQSLEQPPIISNLTKTEFASALARWVRTKELSADEANQIQVVFSQHLEQNLYQVRTMNDSHFVQAERWLAQRTGALRTLDALHLALAMQLEAVLVTCDRALAEAAGEAWVASGVYQLKHFLMLKTLHFNFEFIFSKSSLDN